MKFKVGDLVVGQATSEWGDEIAGVLGEVVEVEGAWRDGLTVCVYFQFRTDPRGPERVWCSSDELTLIPRKATKAQIKALKRILKS